MRLWTQRSGTVAIAVAMLVAIGIPAPEARAQAKVVHAGAIEYRYLGDTIWTQRDSTMSRTVYRGDTIVRATFQFGKLMTTSTYVIAGDDARLVDYRNGQGKALPFPPSPTAPVRSLTGTRSSIASAVEQESRRVADSVRQVQSDARRSEAAAQFGTRFQSLPPREAPRRTADIRTYVLSGKRTMLQHGDTIRDVRGCAAMGARDTTVYVVLSDDSVRRLSPNPATFDRFMVNALFADMSTVVLQQGLAAMATGASLPAPATRLPGVPYPKRLPCDAE